jgi:adenosylcobinamide kinase/adenosylcobinamide-phosphate guanylyltransferase
VGGARSGKSRYAVDQARAAGHPTAFLATAPSSDSNMRERIARHREERPAEWPTIEEPIEIADACRRLARRAEVIVVDCLTLWVTNLLAKDLDDVAILGAAEAFAELMRERPASLIVVSNEVGEGVHPPTAIGLRFRDVLGRVNQSIAAAADRVTLMVAGIPLEIKRAPPSPSPDVHQSPEAP